LGGVYANNTSTDCNIFATCTADDPLGVALNLTEFETVEVADEQLCDLSVPGVQICTEGPMTGALVTDLALCEAPNTANICPDTTDLAGVYVNSTATDCDISIATNPQAQCIKCADLAALGASDIVPTGNDAELQASRELIGANADAANVFSICDNITTATTEFNNVISITGNNPMGSGTAQENLIQNAFALCINNVQAQGLQAQTLSQTQASSLQENSLTTNIRSQAEIPSFNTEPQNTDLSALLENPNVKALLENPDLNALLENPDVNALVENPNVKALLENPDVKALLENPDVKAQLQTQQLPLPH